ncbi:MAG: hypothetical protein M3P40_05275 [Actinomycetota bacterium]|nr:hypothetical protein [Actinomycetota bacterium]
MSGTAAVSFSEADTETLRESLDEARECLAYWEDRAERLPVRAVRKRREAREMSERWQSRVADFESEIYGRGVLGAVLLYQSERRLPEPTRQMGRHVAHRARQAVMVALAALLALLVAGAMAAYELFQAVLQALSQAPV